MSYADFAGRKEEEEEDGEDGIDLNSNDWEERRYRAEGFITRSQARVKLLSRLVREEAAKERAGLNEAKLECIMGIRVQNLLYSKKCAES